MKRRGVSVVQVILLVILVALAGLVVWVWWQPSRPVTPQTIQTRAILGRLNDVLAQYQKTTGVAAPAEGAEWVKGFVEIDEVRTILATVPGFDAEANVVRDAWGNPIELHVRPDASYYFRSFGPDGKSGTLDDVVSDMP